MGSISVSNSTLVFRILTLSFLAASIAVMVTNNFKHKGFELRFKDVKAYWYVLAVAAIGSLYSLIQIPCAVYYVCTEKRLIHHKCLPEFDLHADKVIIFLLATGVGADIPVTYEFSGHLNEFFALLQAAQGLEGVGVLKSDTKNFLNRGYIATGFLFLGFLCMAAQAVLSSIAEVFLAEESESFWNPLASFFFSFPDWTIFSSDE